MSTETLIIAVMMLAGLQSALMVVDEIWYHRRRGLSVLEALGHPIDSAAFLAVILVPALAPPSGRATMIFIALAVASTIIVTKDEGIHARDCLPGEHWLHAMLFVLHAPLLIALGFLWHTDPAATVLGFLPWPVAGVLIYQIAYWGYFHGKRVYRQQRVLRRPGRQVV